MNRMVRRATVIAAGLLAGMLLTTTALAAGPVPAPKFDEVMAKGAQALLEAADLQHNNFTDQELAVQMTISGGSEDGNQLEFTTITKGENMRALRFSGPADMKGMGIVIKGRDEIYVRLPDSPRVRRVAAHARKQSFQGTDFTFDDMGLIRFAKYYQAEKTEDIGEHVKVTAKRKDGADFPWPTLEIHVHKERITIEKVLYIEDDGKPSKQQIRSGFEKFDDGHIIYNLVRMESLKSEHATESKVVREKINQGVKNSTFSKRWLVRSL